MEYRTKLEAVEQNGGYMKDILRDYFFERKAILHVISYVAVGYHEGMRIQHEKTYSGQRKSNRVL